MEINIIFT